MTAIAKNMTDTAYGQLLALRKDKVPARDCVEMTIDSLMEEFGCSRRRAALLVIQAWSDLDAKGKPAAHIDVSHTTGNTVVIKTADGRINIFSVHEILKLRDQAASTTLHIHA